jgi:hypothetical protein
MATVSLTRYEIETDLLPAVCARCGEPATDRRDLVLHILDGWKGGLLVAVLFIGLFFFPPLVLWTLRRARETRVSVPLCAVDYQWFESRARIEKCYLMPFWTAVVLLNNVFIVTEVALGGPGVSCCTVVGVLMGALLASALIARGRIGITGPPKRAVRLTGVHETFAAALAEDRARDRVSNPARRGGHGDLRDDYDDEAG